MARPNPWDPSQARENAEYGLKQLRQRDWGWFVDKYVEAMGLPPKAPLDPIPTDEEMMKAILDKQFPAKDAPERP